MDQIRSKLKNGKLKTGEQIRAALKQSILDLLRTRGGDSDLRLGTQQPGVILVVGVNGGGKTTTIGKLAHKFKSEGVKVQFVSKKLSGCCGFPCRLNVPSQRSRSVSRSHAVWSSFTWHECCIRHACYTPTQTYYAIALRATACGTVVTASCHCMMTLQVLLAAGDTFRAAAAEQLQLWAGRSGVEVHAATRDKARPDNVLYEAVDKASLQSKRLIHLPMADRLLWHSDTL